MPRGVGHVIVRRDPEDPEEPRDWALFIEALFRGLLARITRSFRRDRRKRAQDRESASAKRPR